MKALNGYREERKSVFNSSESQFMTVIYSMMYDEKGVNSGLNDCQKEKSAFIKECEVCQSTIIAETMAPN